MVNVGEFTLASGTITNGACDINEGGNYSTCTFNGTLSGVDPQTGRATVTAQSNNGTSHEAVYVVSAGEFLMEQIDSVPSSNPLLAGAVLQQSGSFNDGSLNGPAVLYYQDIHSGDGLDQSGAMIVSFDGNGNWNTVAMDEDLAGAITQNQPQQGTYAVAANGALTLSGGGGGAPVGFLVSPNQGFFVGTGSNSIFGTMEPQTGGPFSNASFQGTYAGGSLPPLDYANAQNELDVGTADGLGTFTADSDSSGSWGIDQRSGTIVSGAQLVGHLDVNHAADGLGSPHTPQNVPMPVQLVV